MLYDLGFLIFSIFYLPTLIFKGKLHRDFLERFGVYNAAKRRSLGSPKAKIWIQAVSVGEVALCKSLVLRLRRAYPDTEIVLSTITKAGNDLAKKSFSREATIIYFPLDLSFIARKVARLIRPKLFIMIETEIWPNILKVLRRLNVPRILVNGRISDRSFGKYRFVRGFLKTTLDRIDLFCMRSEVDAERIIELGAPEERVRIAGDMKFDIEAGRETAVGTATRAALGLRPDERLFVAGSTHSGEEKVVVSAYARLVRDFPSTRLLIAPRHVERYSEVAALAREFGFEPVAISSLKARSSGASPTDVFIADTIGQLNDFYSVASIVFVGGSLVRHGGQNPIEPAFQGRAIMFGPHMFNFREVANMFLGKRAAVEVRDEKELVEASCQLLNDEGIRSSLGENARKIVLENRGATERNLKAIKEVLQ